jgi:hypothetical protein
MPFRGYFALNGTEIVNNSRVIAHLARETPTDDFVFNLTGEGDCSQTINPDDPGLALLSSSSVDLGNGLATPGNGSRLYDPGLAEVTTCWPPSDFCGCRKQVQYDDSWPGLQEWLGDTIYRVELAPWYNTRMPESAEFGGIWVMDAKGFGPLTISRAVTENIGSGATAGPNRDTSRKLTFDALLLACTNAGLEYGLQWLACELRGTKDVTNSTLTYFTAHPNFTAANPGTLIRDLHGVVMTAAPTITAQSQSGSRPYRQADMYRVSFELTVLNPYVFLPIIDLGTVSWETIGIEPITWAHAPMCVQPASCDPMPVLFSDTCPPEVVNVGTNTPPPVCGGCLPVCAIDRYTYAIPRLNEYPARCTTTAATVTITNTDPFNSLTVQGYWKLCDDSEECGDDQYPVQIAGLPANAAITLDAVSGMFWAKRGRITYIPVGIVSTPNGAPWVAPVIDRTQCWQFVVVAPEAVNFEVDIALADREA